MTPAKRTRSPSLPDSPRLATEARIDPLRAFTIPQPGQLAWSFKDCRGKHKGVDFASLATKIDHPSSVLELKMTWEWSPDEAGGEENTLAAWRALQAFTGLKSLSLDIEIETFPDTAQALAVSLSQMPHLEHLRLGAFVDEDSFAPILPSLPATLRSITLHSAPEAMTCLLQHLHTTPLHRLEHLHLKVFEQLHDASRLNLWGELAKALEMWIPLADSLCQLSYPEEVRWGIAPYDMRRTVKKSQSLHALNFSPDFVGKVRKDVDNNLKLIHPQLTENLDKLVRFPYGLFDALCSAVMTQLSTTGAAAPHDITQLVHAFWMGRNTPRDRWRALALVCVCKAYRDLAAKTSGEAIAAQRLKVSVDRRATILQQYGLATDATVQRLQHRLAKT